MAYARWKANASRLADDSADFDWLRAVQMSGPAPTLPQPTVPEPEIAPGNLWEDQNIWEDKAKLTTMVMANAALWLVLGAYFAAA
jgi:hypothetical protein